MVLGVREPAEWARQVEEHPQLPAAACERVSGYGVMGLPFRSGHVLGLRRWTASSVGEGFTSIWHRDADGVQVGPISLGWEDQRRLRVSTVDGATEWTIELGSTALTRMMSDFGSTLPLAAWRSRPLLQAMGRLAGWGLGPGTSARSTASRLRQRRRCDRRVWGGVTRRDACGRVPVLLDVSGVRRATSAASG